MQKRVALCIIIALGMIMVLLISDIFHSGWNVASTAAASTVAASTAGDLAPILDTFTPVLESGTTSWDTWFVADPCVLLDGNVYKMWFTACSQEPYPFRYVLAYAESSDGITWSNRQMVHDAGPDYTNYATHDPWVLKEDGVYRMWHQDYYEAGWSGYIAHMTSTDGINWPAFMSNDDMKVMSAQRQTVPQGDGYNLQSPCVIHELGGYVMWYSVADYPPPAGARGGVKVWRATSTDGITWGNRQLSLPYILDTWEDDVRVASVVKEDDGTYTMFYDARIYGQQWTISMARSADGITWTERQQLLRTSDLGVDVRMDQTTPKAFHFEDADGKRYLYFYYQNITAGKQNIGRIQLGPKPSYDVTIDAYCYTEGASVSVSITMDGAPTGYTTPHTFAGLTGTHEFTVPSTDANNHPFQHWSTGNTITTVAVSLGGTYTAYYKAEGPQGVPEFPGADISMVAATFAFFAALCFIFKGKKQSHTTTRVTVNPSSTSPMTESISHLKFHNFPYKTLLNHSSNL